MGRRSEDLTTDKTDDKDAVISVRLTAQLRCYLPEAVDETWGRLRHPGARRQELLERHVACVQQISDRGGDDRLELAKLPGVERLRPVVQKWQREYRRSLRMSP